MASAPAAPRHSDPAGADAHASRPQPTGAGSDVLVELPASADGPATGRRCAYTVISAWGAGEQLAETAVLVVSELVTNALRDGAPPIRLRVARDPAGHLVLAVYDGGSRLPSLGSDHLDIAEPAENGFGLQLVDALARTWATTPDPVAGKTVTAHLTWQDRR